MGNVCACTSVYKTSKVEQGEQLRRVPLSEIEQTFDPSIYILEFTPPVQITNEHRTGIIEVPTVSLPQHEEIVQGFRIQIYASSNYDEANSMKTITQGLSGSDSVYIVFDPPVYKVRVGDFVSRYDANQRLLYYVSQGYRDAWVVPDRVILRSSVPSRDTLTE
ncbi:MAG: SPOR domain-containing protein [Bacteroidetes bacterium]|nr:SPOR domain-containing protein [Bacteroidota bacterium]